MLRIEPLEERRLLTHITAPLDFKVEHVPGPLAEEIKLKLSWTDSSGETGYEVERSITGLDDPDGLWEGGFHENPAANDAFINIDVYRRYYFRIRSTGHTGSHAESPWSAPVYAKGTVASPTANIVVPEDNIVKVSAIAHSAVQSPALPAKIELRWPEELAYEDADYKIYRKEKDETSFTPVADLDFEETGRPDYPDPFFGWVDEDLNSKTAYEYKVVRTRKNNAYFNSTTTQGIGYVYAGVDVPLDDDDSTIESPGTVILIVDNTQADALTAELIRLEDDLYAEGWDVIRHDVAPHDDDPLLNTNEDVRDLIIADYTADLTNVKSVFLIGHIPVPMSGWDNPDGHGPRPFPADVFYGDVDGDWTDTTRNTDLRGYQGNYRYNDAGTGDDVASWTFTGLTPGDYEVSVSWKKDTNRATNAPFTIFDDSTEVAGPILVNQRASAAAAQDLTPCSRVGRLRVVSKTPNCSWETAL